MRFCTIITYPGQYGYIKRMKYSNFAQIIVYYLFVRDMIPENDVKILPCFYLKLGQLESSNTEDTGLAFMKLTNVEHIFYLATV